MFDVADHLDALRSWPTDRLLAHHDHLVREQRRLQLEDLDVLRVLDERGQIDTSVGRDGESPRTMREKVETARALESLPAVAAAAHAGALSDEQLISVVKLADEHTDAEWAVRAPQVGPTDLARLARTKTKPTAEEGLARHQARSLRTWWDKDRGMLQLRGELPDVVGAKFEATINRITDRMRPPRGQVWERRDRRQADALLELCDTWEHCEPGLSAAKPLLVVEVPIDGPAEVAGIPLPAQMVEQLRAAASIEPILVDRSGVVSAVGKRTGGVSPKILRAVLLRDGHCRCTPECDVTVGLHVHHIRPSSWGGTDEFSNLLAVAGGHHPPLIPNGPWAVVGNPNEPDGIRRVHVSQLSPDEAAQVGLPPPRARPGAA